MPNYLFYMIYSLAVRAGRRVLSGLLFKDLAGLCEN